MFKNINWKKALLWAANAILALIGGAGAGYMSTQADEAPAAYESAILSDWESPLAYRITATFYKETPAKVGNFTDGKVERDGLGAFTVYSASPSDEAVIEAYEKATGYTKVGILKRIKAEKRFDEDNEEDTK